MKIKISDILKYLMIVFISLFAFTPFEQYKTMMLIIPLFLGSILLILYLDKKFLHKNSSTFYIIGAMFLLDVLLTVSTSDSGHIRFFVTHKLFVYTWLLFLEFYCNKKNQLKTIINITLIIFLFSSIFTIYGNILHPDASRLLATGLEIYKDQIQLYKSMNIGGYDFIYASVFLILPLLNYINYEDKKILYIFLGVEIVTIMVGAYTIGILLAFYSIVFYFIKSRDFKNGMILVLIMTMLILILKEPLLIGLGNIAEMINSDIIVKRSQELLMGTYAIDYSGSRSRVQLYSNAFQNILNSPIGGLLLNNRTLLSSGHSNLLQYFEQYGIFGYIYIYYFVVWYKTVNKHLLDKKIKVQFKLYVVLVMIFVFLDTINSSYCVGIVCFFIGPGMFILADSDTRNRRRNL